MGERLLWATDVHLDHLKDPSAAREFGATLRREHRDASGLIVTGDIAGALTVDDTLIALRTGFAGPLYFVLGNHDYYGSRFVDVDEQVRRTCDAREGLHWLRFEPIRLSETTALIGTDGWYDARYGNEETGLQLSDFMEIADIFEALDDSRASMLALIRQRADHLAREFLEQAEEVLAHPELRQVIVATHIPPFVESCWYKGQTADATYSPYFASRATGDALLRLAESYPHLTFSVLCGHTHSEGIFHARENLTVYTGRAAYGAPDLAGLLTAGNLVDVQLFETEQIQRA